VISSHRENPQRILLTVREVAFVLGCGRTLVYDLIGSRQLPIVKVGRLTRVPAAAVDSFVNRRLSSTSSGTVATSPRAPHRRRSRRGTIVSAASAQTILFDEAREQP
jgi:excisionase family DNA binding protein